LARSLPPGAKPYKVAEALGLLDADRFEERLITAMWRLREGGGRQRKPKSMRQVSEYLAARGEPTPVSWLSEFYTATKSRKPAA
jgi:hypothetical protein